VKVPADQVLASIMTMKKLTKRGVVRDLKRSEIELREADERAIRFCERIRISPALWAQEQYPESDKVWVIAVMGNRCLYFNHVECGWGWGQFEQWGKVSEYHCQDLDIHHVVLQTLFAIDNIGKG
jgi:hypothetical protein